MTNARTVCVFFGLLVCMTAVAQACEHSQHVSGRRSAVKMQASASANAKAADVLYPFALGDVQVSGSSVPGVNQQTTLAYLKSLDVDRFLYFFRLRSNITNPAGVKPYDGWENDQRFYGHFVGHYLSALAQMYASTGDAELATKAEALVKGFADCQAAVAKSDPSMAGFFSTMTYSSFSGLQSYTGTGFACDPANAYSYDGGCVPFYTLHKYMNGLLDWATQVEDEESAEQAADVLAQLSLFVGGFINQTISKAQMWQWDEAMNTEYGGMNDVLYAASALPNVKALERQQLFVAGDQFQKTCFVAPLMAQHELIHGLHANTHLPIVIGVARRYEMTGNTQDYIAVKYFWDIMTQTRTYATGGTSHGEHWYGTDLSHQLGTNDQETCCSYNLAKLTRMLLRWTGEAQYASYYHRVFYNGLLGTIDTSGIGKYLYYTPLAAGVTKSFGDPENSFWCCYGTGIENWSKVGDSIYFSDSTQTQAIYVNLYFSSTLAAYQDITLTQTTNYPVNNSVTFQWHNPSGIAYSAALNVLIPWYVTAGGATVSINGQSPVPIETTPASYYAITPSSGSWKNGDTVVLTLPLTFYAHYMPDNNNMFAVMYGPVVLAGLTKSAALSVSPHVNPPADWLQLTSASGHSLTFQTTDTKVKVAPAPITFMPLNEVIAQQYTTYFTGTAAEQDDVAPSPTHRKSQSRRSGGGVGKQKSKLGKH